MPWIGDRPDLFAQEFHGIGRLRASRTTADPVVDTLIPVERQKAKPKSLSAKFGADEFPLHTDGAYLARPPRLIALYCVQDEQQRTTRLAPSISLMADKPLAQRLLREVFYFINGRFSFLDSIASGDRGYLRFDPACMRPASRGADALLSDCANALATGHAYEHSWEPGSAIVIDNWRVLHGRGAARGTGPRRLMRVQFDPLSPNP